MADLSSSTEARYSIYAIYSNATAKIIYVGQTTYDRDGDRFIEHVNNDTNYPWYKGSVAADAYSSKDDTRWPYYPRKLYDCKDYTALETAAAEEYYWEANGGLEGKLVNTNQPLTKATFLKYSTGSTYRGTAKGFPGNWQPKK